MAPIKLEDNIREKLEARELKPSAEAWNKLETRLESKQPKRKSKTWYYIAASFVGLLILSSLFFNRNTVEVKNEVVKENHENNIDQQSKIIPENSNTEVVVSEDNDEDALKKTTLRTESEKRQKSNQIQLKNPSPKKSKIDKKMGTEAIAKSSKVKKQNAEHIEKPIASNTSSKDLTKTEEDKLIDAKVEEVVASVKQLQDNNTEVTSAEVDVLLKNARREIQTERILKNPKIDATALLQDVEGEMERSFRDKVFDALGDGFNKIRTAVTERNN